MSKEKKEQLANEAEERCASCNHSWEVISGTHSNYLLIVTICPKCGLSLPQRFTINSDRFAV